MASFRRRKGKWEAQVRLAGQRPNLRHLAKWVESSGEVPHIHFTTTAPL